ncbi:MAG: glycosyltransferase [Cryomorphaceae bacterium]|nr:glycosyltransferase [Cryomorphaceae bacterium]
MKRIIVSVTNDLSTDQRVHKTCSTLIEIGLEPLLVGRKLKESLPIDRPYHTHRMRLFFRKKVWFYAEYQLRLFFFLLFRKADGLVANDLDTLLPNYLIAKLKRIPIVYDTHEYYCYTPELIHRPSVQKVWLSVERFIFPRLNHIITVNQSIAQQYKSHYDKELFVVRNISPIPDQIPVYSRPDWNIPENAFVLINQGSGINVDRGMEEMVEALEQLPEDVVLLIVGRGDVIPQLKEKVEKSADINKRVIFIDPQPYNKLLGITRLADVGLSLDKTSNPNYCFSLPNKLFDYIHSGIPVIGSEVFEVAKIIREYRIGTVIKNHDRAEIARAVLEVKIKPKSFFDEGLANASRDAQWHNEVEILKKALKPLEQIN